MWLQFTGVEIGRSRRNLAGELCDGQFAPGIGKSLATRADFGPFDLDPSGGPGITPVRLGVTRAQSRPPNDLAGT